MVAAVERAVEIAVHVAGKLHRQARIAAGLDEAHIVGGAIKKRMNETLGGKYGRF